MIDPGFEAKHYLATGMIIRLFGKMEQILPVTVSGLLEVHGAVGIIVCEPYGFKHLTNVIKALIEMKGPKFADIDHLEEVMATMEKHSALRNVLAHGLLAKGDKPESFKQYRMDIRSGSIIPRGNHIKDKSYTHDDMNNAVYELTEAHKKLIALCRNLGWDKALLRDHI